MTTITKPAAVPLKAYVELMKLRIGTMIALTAVMGYVAVAPTVKPVHLLLLAVAMLLGSAASSIFNHYYDRDIDRLMARTAGRPLASGLIADPAQVLWLAAALLAAGLGLALAAFNALAALHLFLGAFVYAVVYTVWLKRRTWANIVIGGAAGSFAVLAGGAAADPQQWLLPTLLAVTLFLWTPSHFWSLALLLKEDYARARVPMLPCLVGERRTAIAILLNSVLLVAASLSPVAAGEFGPVYGVLAAALGARFLWSNWQLLRQPGPVWARKNFLGSMSYLGGLFIAVVADKLFLG